MAQSSALRTEELKVLDHLRQRLLTLADGINALRSGNLNESLAILNRNVEAITDQLAEHVDLLSRAVVYPQTNYPGRTQGHLLTQILRKKLEPDVETWAVEGRKTWQNLRNSIDGDTREDMDQLWNWAADCVHEHVSEYIIQADSYTAEERKEGVDKVNTGLRRNWFDDEEEEEAEEEDDEFGAGNNGSDRGESVEGLAVTGVGTSDTGQVTMGLGVQRKRGVVEGKSIEDILRFATTGPTHGQA